MEILKQLLAKLVKKEIIIGAIVFIIALWMVYRPDLKMKRILFEFLGWQKPGPYEFNKNQMKRNWESIEDALDKITISTWQIAVEKAYKFFEFTLEKIEPEAHSFPERFRILCQKYTKLENLKTALEIRERLNKRDNYQVNYWEVEDALRRFKESLRELGAL